MSAPKNGQCQYRSSHQRSPYHQASAISSNAPGITGDPLGISGHRAGISGRISAVYLYTRRISRNRLSNYLDAWPVNRDPQRISGKGVADYLYALRITTDGKSSVFTLKVEK